MTHRNDKSRVAPTSEYNNEEEFNKMKNLLTTPTITKPFDDAKDYTDLDTR